MTTERTAYCIAVHAGGVQVVEDVRCVFTPQRVTVSCPTKPKHWSGVMYFDPADWPQPGYAWTVGEAWDLFLAAQRQELETLRYSVTCAEQAIARAEAARQALTASPD